ncbi:hypothetical protein [Kitasatospora sp. NPDC087314]|uniref:hypothetical protein n=1 Tax=Kitasatospora sp. NPDC087314 TaxID=3364068 RepID=UPI0038303F43
MTQPIDDLNRPEAGHYDLARVYVAYGSLPPADHARLLGLLAIADAIRTLTDQLKPATPTTSCDGQFFPLDL